MPGFQLRRWFPWRMFWPLVGRLPGFQLRRWFPACIFGPWWGVYRDSSYDAGSLGACLPLGGPLREFQRRRWIPGHVPVRALYRCCGSLCQDSSNGTGSLGACLCVHSIAPAGADVGMPVAVLDPWVRYWIPVCVLARILCRSCGSARKDPSNGT